MDESPGDADALEVIWECFIPIKPVRWSVSTTRSGRIYNPKTLKDYQADVVKFIKSVYRGPMIKEPIELDCIFYFDRPKSAGDRTFPHVKPDRTNLLKAMEDCLTLAGVIEDDSLIIGGPCYKLYGESGKFGTDLLIYRL